MSDDQTPAIQTYYLAAERYAAYLVAERQGVPDVVDRLRDAQTKCRAAWCAAIDTGTLPSELDAVARQAERLVGLR